MFYRIVNVNPKPDYTVQLTFSGGTTVIVDFNDVIAEGGVYASLADPRLFGQVSIGPRGRFIEWPGNIDFCADALRLEGKILEVDDLPRAGA